MSVPFGKQGDMSFPQFAAAAAAAAGLPASVPQTSASLPPSAQMSAGSPPAPPTPRGCCENGRPVLTDPHTGQTVCSCQYSPTLLAYPRVPPGLESVYSASAYAAAVSQGYMALGAEGSAFYSPLGSSPYDLKESAEAWRTLAAQPAFPYDPMSLYPYGAGYGGGLDLNSRRKNATRENTNTLKAWLYEHRKNPYPTKGEKIMLAIITKMTLTQVSTWFANARRRLKKENKMTWSPRNRSEDGSEAGDGADLADVEGDGAEVGGTGTGNADDDDVGPLSPGREIDVHGMTSSSRPSSPLSPSGTEVEGKEGIINVDEDSCSSFKDHHHHPLHPHHDPHHPHHHHHHHHPHHLASDEIRKSLFRDRSPLRGGGEERRDREVPASSSSCHSGEDEEEKREKEEEGGERGEAKDLVHNKSVSNSDSPQGDSPPSSTPTPSTTTTTSSSSTPTRPKIWSVTEFLHPSSSSGTSSSNSSSSITSSVMSSSQAAMMTAAAARAAILAQAANRVEGRPGGPSPSPFPAGIRPAGLNSGYLYLPPGASAAWAAAANARFGHLGSYPLSLSHTTLSYPYSLSAHTPSKVTLEGSAAAAAMRGGLSMEALREAHLGVMSKLPPAPVVGRPNGSLFSPARDLDGVRGPSGFNTGKERVTGW